MAKVKTKSLATVAGFAKTIQINRGAMTAVELRESFDTWQIGGHSELCR